MGRWTRDGRATLQRTHDVEERAVSGIVYKDFRGCTYVRGVTLDRYWLDKELTEKNKDPKVMWFWVYTPPPSMVDIQCDADVLRHRPGNMRCSATLGVLSPYTDPNTLYDFKTRAPVSDAFTEAVIVDGTVRGVLVTFDKPP